MANVDFTQVPGESSDKPLDTSISPEYLAQSTFAQSPAAAGLDLSAEIMVIMPDTNFAEYQGTRAALDAERLIPAGTTWPEGFDRLSWEDRNFSYWLRRERPRGIKGARKQFLEVDWWILRLNPLNAKSYGVRQVEIKAKELADIIHRISAEGLAERDKQWSRYWDAEGDVKFQAFKALIPGINRPKRWRHRNNTEQSQRSGA